MDKLHRDGGGRKLKLEYTVQQDAAIQYYVVGELSYQKYV
jgi:hypothetical protein